jgi:sugar phosphate isomerase/epimerase
VLDHSDIGISTGAYPGRSLGEALLRIAELAPSAEVCSWGPHSLLDLENARAVAAVGLPFSVHGPFTHEALGSRSRAKRRAAIDLHTRHMTVAAELGATLYVVHPDIQRRKKPHSPRIAATLQLSLEELRALQDELGLNVAVENMPFDGRSHFTAPGDLDLEGMGLALDVGHAAITGTLRAWLADPKATLHTLHLHDNLGHRSGDLHRSLGAGVIDVAPALAVARAAGATIILENTNEADVLASLAHLHDRNMLSAAGSAAGLTTARLVAAGTPAAGPAAPGAAVTSSPGIRLS